MIPLEHLPSPHRPRAHGLIVAVCGIVIAIALLVNAFAQGGR